MSAKILIVDDDLSLCKALENILEENGYKTKSVFSGRDAIDLCQKDKYDIVLIDVRLPDIPGFEVVKKICEIFPKTGIIYIIDQASMDSAIEAVKQKEVISYETKPLNMDRLLSSIRRSVEYKQMEEALRQAEERFRIIVGIAPSLLIITDVKGDNIYVSPNSEKMTGYTREELQGKFIWWVHEDDRPRAKEVFERAFREGVGDKDFEYKAVKKNGELWDALSSWEPVKDEKGSFNGVVFQTIDITKRKKAEEELRNTRNYLESLFDYANAPIIVWDKESKITRFNHAFERLTGYLAEEVVGQNLQLLFPEPSREESLRNIESTLSGEYWESVEIPILRKNGDIRIVLWNSANIYAEDAKTLSATIAQGQDITERKKAEEELRNTRDYLESLFDYANAPIIVWDKESKITRFNHAFERLTGYLAEEVVGQNLQLLFPEPSREESMRNIESTLGGEYWESVEIPILRKDRNIRIVLWNSANIYAEDAKTLSATIAQGQDITERKKTTEELRNTRDYLGSLFDYANAPIIVWNREFKITRFNHAFERLTGYLAEEVVGQNLQLLFPEPSREESLRNIESTLSGEYWESVEIPILRKNGDIRIVLWNSANIYAEDAKTLSATIAQGQDITERKKAEEELRETRDYLEKLFDNANAPIIVWDKEFKITRFNHAFEHLTGYLAEGVVGQNLQLLFPEPSREESLTKIERTLKGEYWKSVEIPILREDGEVRIVLWNSANIYAEEGKTGLATIAQGQDITERKKAEEILRESEQKLWTILNSMTDYCYIVSSDYHIEFMNRSMQKKFGEQIGNICYKTLFDRNSPCPWTKMKEIEDGKTVRWEHAWPELESVFEVIDSPLIHKDGSIAKLSIWRDISERKKAEERIKASLKEKEVLLKEIHHRVKNNLQLIYSLLNLQMPYLKDKHAINIFKESQSRIKSIALLHESLYESEDLARIDFAKYLRSLIDNLLRSYGGSINTVNLKIDIQKVSLTVDIAIPCGLIINELVSNSLKYGFGGMENKEISISLYLEDNNKFILVCKDNGIGFPKELDFKNTTTLGLQLVCTLTEQLGGEIELSRDGGTKFKITFMI